MKKDQPNKDKKVRKTRKKNTPSEDLHTEESNALFSGDDVQNQQEPENSSGEDFINKEIIQTETDKQDIEIVSQTEITEEESRKEIIPPEETREETTEEVAHPFEQEDLKSADDAGLHIDEEKKIQPPEQTQLQPDEEITSEEDKTEAQTAEEEKPISEEDNKEAEQQEKSETIFPKSNYQISLINENLLRIVVETDKTVGVDCIVRNRKPDEEDSKQTQSNRILVHPKEDGKLQEVEIIVSINKSEIVKISGKEVESVPESSEESSVSPADVQEKPKKKFLIDPSVADILKKPVPPEILEKYKPMTREEYFEEKLKPNKNKYAINRAIVEKNLKIGIVTAIIILIFSMIVYSGVTSDNDTNDEQKLQRLIVIQDMPEMKVDIPLESKRDEGNGEEDKTIVTPKINIRRNTIRTPKIELTRKDTTAKPDSSDIAKNNDELDKLRRGDTTGTGTSVSGINSTDTVNANAVSLPFSQYGWVLIDSLDYGGRKFKFSSDTSQVIKDPSEIGRVSDFKMFVIQDIKGTEFSCGKNLKDFPVRVIDYKAYKCEPREEIISNQIEYMYRIINRDNTYAITIKVEYKKEYKPEYYPKVDTLVSQIRLPEFIKTEK